MPWLDICSHSDWASFWYYTNSQNSFSATFDPAKPTILLMHPWALDSSWMRFQVDDPRLASAYNIIGFDMRGAGHTKHRLSGYSDSWVLAADIAFLHHCLRLPPVHVFTTETVAAMRFAALFPEKVLSLTFCGFRPEAVTRALVEAVTNLFPGWGHAPDLPSFEHVTRDWVEYVVGEKGDPDLIDELLGFWHTRYPPTRRSRLYAMISILDTEIHPPANLFPLITQPVMIIQGPWGRENPEEFSQQLVKDFCNAQGGARLYSLNSGSGLINVVESNVVNRAFLKFLDLVQGPEPAPVLPFEPLAKRMTAALARHAEIRGDPTIAERDPYAPISFSVVPAAIANARMNKICEHAVGQENAVNPLGADGLPLRRFQRFNARTTVVDTERLLMSSLPSTSSRPRRTRTENSASLGVSIKTTESRTWRVQDTRHDSLPPASSQDVQSPLSSVVHTMKKSATSTFRPGR